MYELDLESAKKIIKKNNSKRVLIQLPDGLKPKAEEINDFLKKETGSEILIWLGSNFGSCDVPSQAKDLEIDLVIQWGHNKWV